MNNRERDVQIQFRVSEREREFIQKKMAMLGTRNRAAYLRKMAIDGWILHLTIPELKEIIRLLRYSSNNLNQLAKRTHGTGSVYEADITGLRNSFDSLWELLSRILTGLSKIV